MSTSLLFPELALASTTQVLLAIFTLAGLIIWRRPILGKGQADVNLALRYCTFIVIAVVILTCAHAGLATFSLLVCSLVVFSIVELFNMASGTAGVSPDRSAGAADRLAGGSADRSTNGSAAPGVMQGTALFLGTLTVVAACLTAGNPDLLALRLPGSIIPAFYLMPILSVAGVAVASIFVPSSDLAPQASPKTRNLLHSVMARVNHLQIWVALLGCLYVAWCLAHLVLLRGLDCGFGACIFLIACVALNDTFALAFGRLWGCHPLCPSISPNKTWEGLAGGFCGTFLAASLFRFELSGLNVYAVASLAVLIGFLSPAGDLVVSLVKRRFKVQETGKLLPGHGGLLDRFDSLILVAPAFYYALLLFK